MYAINSVENVSNLSNSPPPSPECYTTFWMMTIYSDTLHWSGITPIFDPITDLDLITEFDFLPIVRGFHRTFATGVACQQRTLTPADTWSCPSLGLASVLMLRPISPELVLFLDFWVSNIPRYFCFCSAQGNSLAFGYQLDWTTQPSYWNGVHQV